MYKCEQCTLVSAEQEWQKTYVLCDTCGNHDALECPRCGYRYDLVFGEPEEVYE